MKMHPMLNVQVKLLNECNQCYFFTSKDFFVQRENLPPVKVGVECACTHVLSEKHDHYPKDFKDYNNCNGVCNYFIQHPHRTLRYKFINFFRNLFNRCCK